MSWVDQWGEYRGAGTPAREVVRLNRRTGVSTPKVEEIPGRKQGKGSSWWSGLRRRKRQSRRCLADRGIAGREKDR
jgi:hypothetical protein